MDQGMFQQKARSSAFTIHRGCYGDSNEFLSMTLTFVSQGIAGRSLRAAFAANSSLR